MTLNKFRLLIIALSLASSIALYAQSDSPEETAEATGEEELIVAGEKLTPLLPRRDRGLIFVEGEDAVSTNFNREPILNYSTSGFRTLQLNQTNELHNEGTYNADYVFYVEEDGVYELWYGGTPPGNRDEVIPSFASSFRYVLDGLFTTEVYREDMDVVSEYAPSYYWNYVNDLTLASGDHRIKFEVLEKRSLDGRYYFYLDNFFLIKKENGQRVSLDSTPDIFPADMDDRTIDKPFGSFEEYELKIRDNPEIPDNYILLAKMYSLAGDYLNALKYLRRADFLSPDEPEIMLLIAKNLIWKGSPSEGLEMYKELLEIIPDRIDLWTEAGKIAAWTGLYSDSVEFYEEGLKNLPDDLNLMANMGITYLWMGDANKGEIVFEKAAGLAGNDLDMNRELAAVYRINGYPEKAVGLYKNLIAQYPEELQLYFDLEETYIESDKREKIQNVRDVTEKTFIPNTEYAKVTGAFYESQNMKEKVISDYEEQLQADPENLNLRRVLAEIYFWNGYKKKAVSEYRNILASYTYTNILETEQKMVPFLELIDRNYALSHYLKALPSLVSEKQKEVTALLKSYQKARMELEALKNKGEDLTAKEDEITGLEEKLAASIFLNETYLNKFEILASQYEEEQVNLDALLEDEKTYKESYDLLMEGVNWEWNRNDMIAELKSVKEDGVVLGNFILGKIALFEGDTRTARNNFAPLTQDEENMLGTAPYALYQTLVWQGEEANRTGLLKKFTQEIENSNDYVYYLNEYLDFLYLEEEDFFSYLTDDPEASVAAITDSYKTMITRAAEMNKAVKENTETIHAVLVDNMERGFYNLASQTYLLRNELGDLYYNQKQYARSIVQYEQVLAVDPWNLSAKFKLAQVYHQNGDWASALNMYREIYEEDPDFNNVASFYNELIREFSDRSNFYGRSFSDPSSLTLGIHGDYLMKISPTLGMQLDYDAVFDRVYYAYDGTDPSDAMSLLLNSASISFPLTYNFFNLKPQAGLHMKTDLVDGSGRDSAGDPVDWDSDYGLVNYTDFYFFGGADLGYSKDFLSLVGDYRFNWLQETLRNGSDQFYHQLGADLGINFLKSNTPFLQNTTLLASGEGKLVSDGNILWNTSFQAENKIRLNRAPLMSLVWGPDFSLEDAVEGSDDYWTPDMSLMTGLNLAFESEFITKNRNTVNEKIWFNGDYASSGSGDDQTQEMVYKAGNSLSFSKKDYTAFLNVSGTFSIPMESSATDREYWSLTLEFGISSLYPDYLIP